MDNGKIQIELHSESMLAKVLNFVTSDNNSYSSKSEITSKVSEYLYYIRELKESMDEMSINSDILQCNMIKKMDINMNILQDMSDSKIIIEADCHSCLGKVIELLKKEHVGYAQIIQTFNALSGFFISMDMINETLSKSNDKI